MKPTENRLPDLSPLGYLLLVTVAIAFPFLVGAPVAGALAVMITLPWSIPLLLLLDALNPALMAGGCGMVAIAGSGSLNALLICWIRHKRAGRQPSPEP